MFEYARDKFTKEIVITEEKLKLLEKEKVQTEEYLKIVYEVENAKQLVKWLLFTFSVMAVGFGIYAGTIGLIACGITYVFATIALLPALVPNDKIRADVVKLSVKNLQGISSDLNSKIKDLDISINAISKKLDEYKGAIKFFDVSDSVQDSLNNLDYAYKYARDEKEYNDMCKKLMLYQEESDKFINEPIDYRNTHVVLNDIDNEEVKKLTKSYRKI